MSDINRRAGSTPAESPPLSAGGRGSGATRSGTGGTRESGASSPLLQTEMMPEDDGSCCPYCHKDYRKPRVLDCLHSMCEDCIIAQLDGRRDAAKARELEKRMATDCVLEERGRPAERPCRPTPPGVIRCPVCLQESHVGNDIRFVHSMLVDYVRASETAEEPRAERNCRACKSEMPSLAFCRQCGSDLCGNCLQAHRDMRMFDGHEVMSYEELEATGRAADARRVLCSQHGQPYVVLCATCEALTCRSCLESENHTTHKMVDVTPIIVKTIANEIRETGMNVKKKWSDALDAWREQPDKSASLHAQFENAKARIDLAYEEAARVLEASKLKKLEELEELRDRQEAIVDDLYRKVDATQTKIDDAYRFTERLLDNANGMEILASRKKVIHQLRSLEHTMPSLSSDVQLHFQPVPQKVLEERMRNIVGEVLSHAIATSSSMVADAAPITTRISAAESEWLNGGSTTAHSQSTVVNGGGGGGGGAASHGLMLGNGSIATTTASITPIGGERAERKKAQAASSGFSGGWPPSSNPPELPSPSPPKDLPGVPASVVVPSAGVVGAPSPTPRLPTGVPQLPPAAAAAAAFNAANAAASQMTPAVWAALTGDPRMAAVLGGYAGLNSATAIKMQVALMLQQQQQQQNTLRQFNNLPLVNGVPSIPGVPTSGVLGTAPSSGPEASLLTGLAKGMQEIKLAFAHGSGNSGATMRDLHSPGGFAVSENDDILIADTNNHRIVVISQQGAWKFGRAGQEDGQLCFPRRVVVMKGTEPGAARYVVIDKAVDNKSRAQLFGPTGEFIRRINLTAVVPKGGIEVWAATSSASGHLVMVDQASVIYTLDIKEAQPRVVNWCDASNHLMEASDVAVHEKCIYVTDFKGHCVHVFSHEGTYLRKIGEPSHTPFPIGIDVYRTGEIFVAHTHGNKLTIVAYAPDGTLLTTFVNCDFRMSRCAALRITSTGSVVTLSKHAHTLYGFRRVVRQ